MITEQDLYAYLDSLSILHQTVEHRAVFTVEDGRDLDHMIPGMPCKNLFLKDKKGKLWLIVMPGLKRAQLSPLEKAIGSARLSFGRPELLQEVLAITPGSVTPFALMNDESRRINVVLDSDMMEAPMVNFHPLRNTASTSLMATDLLKFVKSLTYTPVIANCGVWEEGAELRLTKQEKEDEKQRGCPSLA
ncbi:MAG: prolyl-tRNA synthetase associated domain-containing protein [Alphaproteobacteria bacterium]|nr:prolyl-tRNA synthetase associated domain-containing protein [Alphaproteobacteria bacterium]